MMEKTAPKGPASAGEGETMPEEDTVQLLLCTRNEELAGRLRRLLEHWAQENCVRAAVTVSPALPGAAPDLLFLDGDTAEALPPERPAALGRAGVVVVSRGAGRAIAACRWHASAYLPPRPTRRELQRAMDGCFAAWRGGLQWLDLPARRDRVRLPLCQLRYAEACGREVSLFCTGGCIQASVPLKKLEEQLPSPPFFRCQKGFLVHLAAVGSLGGGVLTMAEDGRQITVSRQQIGPLREALARWREEEELCISR